MNPLATLYFLTTVLAGPAHHASLVGMEVGRWRNPGDDLGKAAFAHRARPTQNKALTWIFGKRSRSAAVQA